MILFETELAIDSGLRKECNRPVVHLRDNDSISII